MLAEDLEGLLKFIEKSSLQLASWLDIDGETQAKKINKRQRNTKSISPLKTSTIAIKRKLQSKEAKKPPIQHKLKGRRKARNPDITLNSERIDDFAASQIDFDNHQKDIRQSPNLISPDHRGEQTAAIETRISQVTTSNVDDNDSTVHHNPVLDGQLSLVISAEDLNSIEHAASISPRATHLSPIEHTMQFHSIHSHQHYYQVPKDLTIDTTYHNLHEEPFSNHEHLPISSNNTNLVNISDHHHHPEITHLSLNHHDHHHSNLNSHNHQQQQHHDHLNQNHLPAHQQLQSHQQHQSNLPHHPLGQQLHHHHQHTDQSQQLQQSIHSTQSRSDHKQLLISHRSDDQTANDCYQNQGSLVNQSQQHQAHYHQQSIESQWLNSAQVNPMGPQEALQLASSENNHIDDVIRALDSPEGHRSLDQVHFSVPLYHHSYYNHHQADHIDPFNNNIGEEAYVTNLVVQNQATGSNSVSATNALDSLPMGQHTLNIQRRTISPQNPEQQPSQQIPHQRMTQAQGNLDVLTGTNDLRSFSARNINNYDQHREVQHSQHSIDDRRVQTNYHCNSPQIQHQPQSQHHSNQQHHLHTNHHHHHLSQHQNHHQHNQLQQQQQQMIPSLINGLEPNGVILQDINLASASWSSPEDLYTI